VRPCTLAAFTGLVAACRAGVPLPASPGIPPAAPAALGFDSTRLAAAVAYLRAEVDSGAFPGAVLAVGRHGRLALAAPVGHYGVDDHRPVEAGTIYDLASLTKVVGLTTACMILVDEGKLALDAAVQRYLPGFRGAGKDQVTIRNLLTHSSGLPAWRQLYAEADSRGTALWIVNTTPLDTSPGKRYVYSDLGAIVLTEVVERIAGEPLDAFLDARVFRRLGMPATRFLPPQSWRDRIAPTENDTNALDLSRFAAMLLNEGSWDSVQLIRSETVAEFTRRQDLPPGSTRALGWDTPSMPREDPTATSSAGTKLSARAFGHTGFTGTSLWMDPEKDLFIILLTNRVHPTRANTAILRVRPRVADLVMDALTRPEL